MNPISFLHLGNVVRLRSGGPTMIVEREPEKAETTIQCVWFDGGETKGGAFPRKTLDKVKA